jgi:hypothetical protein
MTAVAFCRSRAVDRVGLRVAATTGARVAKASEELRSGCARTRLKSKRKLSSGHYDRPTCFEQGGSSLGGRSTRTIIPSSAGVGGE